MEKQVLENEYEIVVPLFGAAFATPNKGTSLDLYQQCSVLQKNKKNQGLFKAF